MKFIRHVLDNGMVILMIPIKMTELVSVGFFIDAGAKDDGHHLGLAHFLEHMMFSGTEKRSREQIFKSLDGIGSDYNAITTAENTYYYINGHCDDIKKILDIVLDIYLNPVFKPNRITKESKVIIEEMRIGKDNPYNKLSEKMHQTYFKGTQLGRTIIGTEESVSQIKQHDLINFREKYYTPQNTVFVISGNFNPKRIYPLMEPPLIKLTNPDMPTNLKSQTEKIIHHMHAQNKPYIYTDKNLTFYQAYILLSFPLYNLHKTNEQEINIISHLLSSGFSSRLFTSLRINHGRTYSSSAYPLTYGDVGIFIIKRFHKN